MHTDPTSPAPGPQATSPEEQANASYDELLARPGSTRLLLLDPATLWTTLRRRTH